MGFFSLPRGRFQLSPWGFSYLQQQNAANTNVRVLHKADQAGDEDWDPSQVLDLCSACLPCRAPLFSTLPKALHQSNMDSAASANLGSMEAAFPPPMGQRNCLHRPFSPSEWCKWALCHVCDPLQLVLLTCWPNRHTGLHSELGIGLLSWHKQEGPEPSLFLSKRCSSMQLNPYCQVTGWRNCYTDKWIRKCAVNPFLRKETGNHWFFCCSLTHICCAMFICLSPLNGNSKTIFDMPGGPGGQI